MFTKPMKAHVARPMTGVVMFAVMFTAGACAGSNPEPETGTYTLPASLNPAVPTINAVNAEVPGLSQSQSILGAGSLLGLARMKMPANQYTQLTTAIPGSDALINEATRLGLPGSALTDLAGVTNHLGQSGISTDQINGMIRALDTGITGKVSPEVQNSFRSALR